MDVAWWMYVAFIVFVIAMLVVDLRFGHAEAHEPVFKESLLWAAFWIGLGLLFGVGVYLWQGPQTGAEYFTGFIVEKALSVDNMFVFVVIFTYFHVPFAYQHQVLFWGILGAMIFRGIFIALGVALISAFDVVILLFGLLLFYTAYRIGRGAAEEVDPEHNPVLKFAEKRFPTTTRYDGQKLFTRENGKRVATPLFVVLLFIETTDIVFAIDSIPAIFGITQDPFIVLTSNVFAILGLRALYFVLGGAMNRLHLLHYGLAVILGFIGLKMVGEFFHFEIPIWLSLLFIVAVLVVTTILSLKIPPKEEEEKKVAPEGPMPSGDGSAEAKQPQPERPHEASDDGRVAREEERDGKSR